MPKVDVDTKEAALQLLVDKGVLTKRDFTACMKAIRSFSKTKKSSDKSVIYEDDYIAVTYKGYEEQNMLGGNGIKLFLIIENKTDQVFSVRARKSINGFITDKDLTLSSDIPEFSKVIENTTFFYTNMKFMDINSLAEVENISFLFRCVDKHYKEINVAMRPAVITL